MLASLPNVPTIPTPLALGGGLVTTLTPAFVPPGSVSYVMNYEEDINGGYERAGEHERFDGRPAPSAAVYVALAPATSFSGVVVGDAVNGLISGATGVVCALSSSSYIAMTKVVGTFTPGEVLRVGATSIGLSSTGAPQITSEIDATVLAVAAGVYRADITAVPGSGPVRGVSVLGDALYAWRDNAGATACVIHKSGATGWQPVTLYHQVSFTSGGTAYAEGATITQGANSATVKRVALESGAWGGTAVGRLIVTAPTPGNFAAGAAAGGGTCTLAGANVQIALAVGGRVEAVPYGFTAAAGAQRLYGCDGVNAEFEFDGAVYVPLSTGMTNRAQTVWCHKNHLFYAWNGSLQHSGINEPYKWSPIFGAAEIGTGDYITGMMSVAGSESAAALMVMCRDSAWVLYGNSAGASNSGWTFVKIADRSGSRARAMVYLGDVVTLDQASALRWRPTQAFGNFVWESASVAAENIVRAFVPLASTSVRQKGRARWFDATGRILTATLRGKRLAWMTGQIDKVVNCAVNDEIAGLSRTFYGCTDGFVYEADAGRSMDGAALESLLVMSAVNQGAPMVQKQYRWAEVECASRAAFSMQVGASFSDQDPTIDMADSATVSQLGLGGRWDVTNWDASFWDGRPNARTRVSMRGHGYNVAPTFYQNSAIYLPHSIRAVTTGHTARRLVNFKGT